MGDFTDHEFEVWQDDIPVASACATDRARALQEAQHYAAVYGQDGPVTIVEVIRRPIDRPSSPAGEGWQSMETAPKDGTKIVAWSVHANARYSDDPVGEGWAAPVLAHWIDHNAGGWTWNGLAGQFTCWVPAPPPHEGGE